ncbi:MAG: multidrug efflux MFS transporter [bacterium]|nr:multidrug efflux MFS transporter [bacterium]
MSGVTGIGLMEAKKYGNGKVLVVLMVILLLVFFIADQGVGDYKHAKLDNEEFRVLEEAIFENIRNYFDYSKYGFKITTTPSPAMVLHHSVSIMTGVYGRINSVSLLNMLLNAKRLNLEFANSLFAFRFAPVMQWLGGLVVLFWGFHVFRRKEYLKFLTGGGSFGKVYFTVFATHALAVTLIFLVLYGCAILIPLIQGVPLTPGYFEMMLDYILSTLLMLLVFLAISAFVGARFPKKLGYSALLVAWLILAVAIPYWIKPAVSDVTERMHSSNKLDSEKKKVTNDFETYSEEKYGKFDKNNMERERQIIEDYKKNHFVKMQNLETAFRNEIAGVIDRYMNYAVLFPTTFNKLTSEEIGSRGYGNYLAFYDYLIRLRRLFTEFWIDMVYYQAPGRAVKNFVQNGENIFQLRPRRSSNFSMGAAVNFGWALLFLVASFVVAGRSLAELEEEDLETLADMNLVFKSDELRGWHVDDETPGFLIYNVFTGNTADLERKGLKGPATIDGAAISRDNRPKRLADICHADDMPDELTVRSAIDYVARRHNIPSGDVQTILARPEIAEIAAVTFGELKGKRKWELKWLVKKERKKWRKEKRKRKRLNRVRQFEAMLLLAELSGMNDESGAACDAYLIHDIAGGCPTECAIKLKTILDRLSEKAIVVYLTGTDMDRSIEMDDDKPFKDARSWFDWLESQRLKKNSSAGDGNNG